MQYLFRFEIKGIQAFIFSTNKLKEIAGASAIVDGLFTMENCTQFAVQTNWVKQCAAGSATILFPSLQTMESFVQSFPMVVEHNAPGIELVYAWIPYEVTEANVDPQVERLMHKLSANRNKKRVQLPELNPMIARYNRTGGGVVPRMSGSKAGNGLVDRATQLKQTQGIEVRSSFHNQLLQGLTHELDLKGECFEKDPRMIAVVHIDGNDIGKRVAACKSLQSYQEFSTALTTITKEATRHAIQHFDKTICDGDLYQNKLPLRPIVLGGDDLTIIIDAKYALSFVNDYVTHFRKLSAEQSYRAALHGRMEASAGVAFVKSKSPFAGNYHLSESLCSYAKNVLRERGKRGSNDIYTPSAVAFHRVTTTAYPDWSGSIVPTELTVLDTREGIKRLNASPYLLGEQKVDGYIQIKELFQLYKIVQEAPRGALREWARVVQKDTNYAKQRWERFQVVNPFHANDLNRILPTEKNGFVERVEGKHETANSVQVTPIVDCLTLKAIQHTLELNAE